MGDGGHDLGHVAGRSPGTPGADERAGLLGHDGHLGVERRSGSGCGSGAERSLRGVMIRPVRVVLGVGRGDQHHVERQAELVAPDLDVALLQHVEETDLDPLGEVRQLVDGEIPGWCGGRGRSGWSARRPGSGPWPPGWGRPRRSGRRSRCRGWPASRRSGGSGAPIDRGDVASLARRSWRAGHRPVGIVVDLAAGDDGIAGRAGRRESG